MKYWTRYIVLMFLLQFAGAVESSGQEGSWLRNGTIWYYNYHEGMDDPRSVLARHTKWNTTFDPIPKEYIFV